MLGLNQMIRFRVIVRANLGLGLSHLDGKGLGLGFRLGVRLGC